MSHQIVIRRAFIFNAGVLTLTRVGWQQFEVKLVGHDGETSFSYISNHLPAMKQMFRDSIRRFTIGG